MTNGLALLDQEEWDEALQLAERALDLDPANAEALDLRNRAAANELTAARRRVAEHINQARRLLEAGDLSAALDQAQRALHVDPANEEAAMLRYQIKVATESAQGARKREAQLLVRRGRRMLDAEAWQEASDFADRAMKLDPDNSDAATLLSSASAALGAAKRLGASTAIAEPEPAAAEVPRVDTTAVETGAVEVPATNPALSTQATQIEDAVSATVAPRPAAPGAAKTPARYDRRRAPLPRRAFESRQPPRGRVARRLAESRDRSFVQRGHDRDRDRGAAADAAAQIADPLHRGTLKESRQRR